MIRQVLGTLGTKLLVTGFTFLIVMLNTRTLGTEGQGTAALINLAIAFILALNNFVGGGAVVYLSPRLSANQLLLPSYLWASVLAFLSLLVLYLLPFYPAEFVWQVALLGWMHSIFLINMHLMLGKDDVHGYNYTMLIQVGGTLAILSALFYIFEQVSIESYLTALLCGFGMALIYSYWKVRKYLSHLLSAKWKDGLSQLWKYGSYGQLGNLIHLGNKRLSLILVETLSQAGRSGVGIYSIGAQLSEALWMLSSSLATVQYSKISNSEDKAYNLKLSLRLMRLSLLLVGPAALMLALVPDALYSVIFGSDLEGLQKLVWLLIPGIIAIALDSIIAHHLSGNGLHKYNTYASIAGILTLVLSGIPLVMYFGLIGAAMGTSIGFMCQTIYHWLIFAQKEKVGLSALWPEKGDWTLLVDLLKSARSK